MCLIHATQEADSVLPPTPDQRIASWAVKYFGNGHHHRREKPRVRVTYPDVEMTREPVRDCPTRDQF